MEILIVEDEKSIREVISAYLSRAEYNVLEAEDGEIASKILKEQRVDGVVLDLNLPGKDGLTLCKEIRQKDNTIPILMVTARTEELDELTGLELGADDYITKPFSPNVLVARVDALFRRIAPETLSIGDLFLDSGKMLVLKKGKKINLTAMQFDILKTLASKPGHVYSREALLNKVYKDGVESDVLDRTIDAHIKSIRKAIEDNPKKPKYIITAIGKGYKCSDELQSNKK